MTILSLVLALSVPVLAASSSWSFYMERRYVNGADNGQYHTLNEGAVYIEGSVSSPSGPADSTPYDVYVTLYREKFGSDVSCGDTKLGHNTDFDTFLGTADKESDKYYLVFYKADDDEWDTTGIGTVTN